MKIKNIHINLLFLILGIFSLQPVEFDSFSNRNLFLETEIEESIYDSTEIDFEKQLSDSDGGNNAIISISHPAFINLYIAESALADSNSKDLSQKPHLFILYCCLKLDC